MPSPSTPASPPQGETGTDTIAATGASPSWPPATTGATHAVKLSLSLPLSVAEFNLEKQAKFKEAIARAAGASPADVAIDNIEALSSDRRRLLASGVRLDVSVKAKDKAAADAMGAGLTAGNINSQLSKVSLCSLRAFVRLYPNLPASGISSLTVQMLIAVTNE